ncbi:MAG TPA: septum formation inhibitor Maf, partial [Rhodobiaceae bacterium]|nr:septum formation inhibitor Maf [Rhodobiaceae bacterium]
TQTWSLIQQVHLKMRDFSDEFLDAYLEQAGENVLKSVGCYQLEGPGIQLFEAVDGDYFAILGLPLLPLLAALRARDAVVS